MGQIWDGLQNTFKYRIPDDVVNKATGNVFDNLTAGKISVTKKPLTYDRLHEAITAVFKKINETIPGANCIAPSKDYVDKTLKESVSGKRREEINREEFGKFVRKFSHGRLVATCAKEVVLVSLAVLAASTLIKEAARRLPKVGNLLATVPISIFFTTVALAVVIIVNKFFQKTPPSQLR